MTVVPRTSTDLEREAAGLREVLLRKRAQGVCPQEVVDALLGRVTEVAAQCLLLDPGAGTPYEGGT